MIELAHDADRAAELLSASLTLAGGFLTYRGGLLTYRAACSALPAAAAHAFSQADREALEALTSALENLTLTPARPAPVSDPTVPEYRSAGSADSMSYFSGPGAEPGVGEALEELEGLLARPIEEWAPARRPSPHVGPIVNPALADGARARPSTGCGARKGIAGALRAARDAVLEKASLRGAHPGAGRGGEEQGPTQGDEHPGPFGELTLSRPIPPTLARPESQTSTR